MTVFSYFMSVLLFIYLFICIFQVCQKDRSRWPEITIWPGIIRRDGGAGTIFFSHTGAFYAIALYKTKKYSIYYQIYSVNVIFGRFFLFFFLVKNIQYILILFQLIIVKTCFKLFFSFKIIITIIMSQKNHFLFSNF